MIPIRRSAALAAAAILSATAATAAAAQNTPADSALQRQQRTLDSLAALIRALNARIDSLTRARPAGTPDDELAALRAAAAAASADSAAVAAPRQARLGQNALNPEISVTAIVHSTLVDPGPQTETFDQREVEFSFQSALDPFSYTKIFVAASEEGVEIEEGYVYWAGLPGHFRLDIGRFRQPLGELNRWHLHALPQGDLPLAHRLYLGEEGLAGTGASLYWPLPLSGRGGTFEWTLQATKGTNEELFAGGDRVSVLSQLSGFWQLSRSTFAQVSLSGAYGTNPDTSLESTVGVLAARFSWRPPADATRREVTLRSELFALRRRFAGAGAVRRGGYLGAQVRLSRRWIAGARADYAEAPDPFARAHAQEAHATLTFWQSEFVYLRAEYTRGRDSSGAESNRVGLHFVWAMGPHKHELF